MSETVRLVALNGSKLECYGYSKYIDYERKGFEGHQVGVTIALMDKNQNVVKNFLPQNIENRDEVLNRILHDDDLVLTGVMKYIPEIDENIKLYAVAYPYAVEGHTVYEPTENFSMIPTLDAEEVEKGISYQVLAEALFVIPGANRYVTEWFKIDTEKSLSLYDMGNRLKEKLLSTADESGVINLYDELGDDVPLISFNEEDQCLDDSLISLRVVRIERFVPLNNE